MRTPATHEPAAAEQPPATDVQQLLLALGAALTMTGDAVSEVERQLREIATTHGHPAAHISVLPTAVLVSLGEGRPPGLRTIDSFRALRLDQASEVIRLARAAERGRIGAADAVAELGRILRARPRFGTPVRVLAHGLMTVGLGLVIHPTTVDLWAYAALGLLVGALKAWAARFETGGYLLAIVCAGLVSAIAFLAHGGNETASLRLTIPPLVTFLPGALLTMATVDLAMGETVTGASRFVAGMLQLALLAIGIVVGAELVGNPHSGPVAGEAADTLGRWSPWVGVAVFGVAVFVHDVGPRRSLPWLLVVLFSAWIGQLVGRQLVDATLSGFVGAAAMVPVAHLVGRVRTAPPAHVMFLPAFWLLVPGTIGLIGLTELVSDNAHVGSENLGTALVAIPAVALGILVGTMIGGAGRIAARTGLTSRFGAGFNRSG